MKEYHNMTGSKIYNRWKQIKRRTMKPNAHGYQNYGGRGVTMCKEWQESFMAFYEYMGEPPTPRHTIERIDNDGNYEPGNVRWASYSEQLLNQRKRNNLHGAGVRKTKGTYWAMITIKGKRIYLGSYKTAEDAHKAYLTEKEKYALRIKKLSTRDGRHRRKGVDKT